MVIPDVTVPTDTALAEQSLLQVVFQLQHFKTNVYLVSNKLEVWGGAGSATSWILSFVEKDN